MPTTQYNIFIGGVPKVYQRLDENGNAVYTVTPGSEDPDGPVENLLTPHLGEPWRTESLFPHHTTILYEASEAARTNGVVIAGIVGAQDSGVLARVRKGPAADVVDVVAYADAEISRSQAVGAITNLEVDPRSASAFDDVVESDPPPDTDWSLVIRFDRPAGLASDDYAQLLTFAARAEFADVGEEIYVEMVDSGGTLIRELYHQIWQTGDDLELRGSARFGAGEFAGDLYIRIRVNGPNLSSPDLGAIRWEQTLDDAGVYDSGFVRPVPVYSGPLAGYAADEIAALSTPLVIPFRDAATGALLDREDLATRIDLYVDLHPEFPGREILGRERRTYQLDIGKIDEFPMIASTALEHDATLTFVDRSIRDESIDKTTHIDAADVLRKVSISLFGLLSDGASLEILDAVMRRGRSTEILVQLYPEQETRALYTVWGYIQDEPSRTIGRAVQVTDKLTIQEIPIG